MKSVQQGSGFIIQEVLGSVQEIASAGGRDSNVILQGNSNRPLRPLKMFVFVTDRLRLLLYVSDNIINNNSHRDRHIC